MKDKTKGQGRKMIKDEEKRLLMANPITKGIDTSIAMGIDTSNTPLPLEFIKTEEGKE